MHINRLHMEFLRVNIISSSNWLNLVYLESNKSNEISYGRTIFLRKMYFREKKF